MDEPKSKPDRPAGAAPRGGQLENASPGKILRWAKDRFGDHVVLASALGAGDMALLDMCRANRVEMPAFFIDTGFHFPETLDFKRRVEERYDMRFDVLLPAVSREALLSREGADLPARSPDRCCAVNKVEPLGRYFKKRAVRAWVTALRRDQGPTRAGTPVVEESGGAPTKISPLATWTWDDVWAYIRVNDVPVHPLHANGYPSVGCAPCTRKSAGEREGRWASSGKTECGIHTFQSEQPR